ncbi:MAG: hypothetical protein U1A28_03530 [Patescibacteria group bacterium]|nr:hypothetical protein [Patescibacteria group bacterium]
MPNLANPSKAARAPSPLAMFGGNPRGWEMHRETALYMDMGRFRILFENCFIKNYLEIAKLIIENFSKTLSSMPHAS